jgi:hypothetical protein
MNTEGTIGLFGDRVYISNAHLTGSLVGTASFVATASFAQTASSVGTLRQAVEITGSIRVLGDLDVRGTASFLSVTASNVLLSQNTITAYALSGSIFNAGFVAADSSSQSNSGSLLYNINTREWTLARSLNISGSLNITGSGAITINGAPLQTGGGGATVTISGSAPSGSKDSGSMWWNSEDGNLYIQVTSPTGSTYVPAVNSVAGGEYGATYRTNAAGATWNINHNLNTTSPLVTVYSGSSVMIPDTITNTDANNTTITFAAAVSGSVVLSTGIGGPTSSSFALSTTSASFATTASTTTLSYGNVFLGGTWPTANNTDITIRAVSGSGITTAANVITLQNAGVYTLSANCSIPSNFAEYFWVDTSNVQVPGTNVGLSAAPTGSFSTAAVTAAGIITAAAGTQIKLRTSIVNGVVADAPYYYNIQIIQIR